MTKLHQLADLIGMAEAAEMAGVSQPTIANWKVRDEDFPTPLIELRRGPIYSRTEMAAYLTRHRTMA